MNEITNALYAEIDRLKAENKKLTIKTSNSLANNLCPDHRDKQAGKPCLACEIDRLKKRVGELEAERDKLRIEASHDLAIASDEWKRIALEAQEKIEDLFQDMREIGVAE